MASSLLPPLNFYFNPTPKPRNRRRKHPPIYISTKPSDLNPLHLRDLFHSANLSCHRFPNLSIDGRPEPVDLYKLRTALKHSAVVVSVFCKSKFLSGEHWEEFSGFGFEELFDRTVPMSETERKLVGFGRAVSDGGLTASIHDIVVIPSLQGLGIGRKIVERIIRILTRRDIYDISALCSEKERLVFKACGFGDDSLGSTTMMYTRTVSSYTEGYPLVKQAGRMLLLVPPTRDSYQSMRTAVEIEDVENQ